MPGTRRPTDYLCIWMRVKLREPMEGGGGRAGGGNADAARLWSEATADKRNGAALDLPAGVFFTRVGMNVSVLSRT